MSLIDHFAKGQEAPGLKDLIEIYCEICPEEVKAVVPIIRDRVLPFLTENHLQQLVCRTYYVKAHHRQGRKKSLVMVQMMQALKVSKATVYRWCEEHTHPAIQPKNKINF